MKKCASDLSGMDVTSSTRRQWCNAGILLDCIEFVPRRHRRHVNGDVVERGHHWHLQTSGNLNERTERGKPVAIIGKLK